MLSRELYQLLMRLVAETPKVCEQQENFPSEEATYHQRSSEVLQSATGGSSWSDFMVIRTRRPEWVDMAVVTVHVSNHVHVRLKTSKAYSLFFDCQAPAVNAPDTGLDPARSALFCATATMRCSKINSLTIQSHWADIVEAM